MRADGGYRAELEYAVDHGIPHSILLGRPWPRRGEPLWLPEDLDKLHAVFADRSARCGRCGTYPDDWVDEGGFPLAEPAYMPEVQRCHGCRRIELKRDSVPPKEKGVYVTLEAAEWVDDEDLDDEPAHAGAGLIGASF